MKSKISAVFFLLTILTFPQEPIKIISSDFNSILIEFSPDYKKSEHVINGRKFTSLDFNLAFTKADNRGMPAIPEYYLNVGVPSETGNTIEVLNSVYTEDEGMIAPVPKMVKDGELYRYEYEISQDYYNYKSQEELVTFGEFGIVRGIKAQTIKILPVKFDPSTGKIKLYSKIIFRINFIPSAVYKNNEKDDLASGSVINYEIAKQWKKPVDRLSKRNAVTNSVLAEGTWVRFEAPTEGFYRITRSMLASYGIDAGVDPRTIKIYNNGGKMLPENAGAPRPVDLQENAIIVSGEGDGRFDEGDYILFYGRGNSFWDYDTTSKTIKRYYHLYSKENYYWITSGGANGKRIQNKPSINTTPGYVQTSTKAFADWEIDRINIGRTGRINLGDEFSQSMKSRVYVNTLDSRLEDFPIRYKWSFINSAPNAFSLNVYENSIQIFSETLSGPFFCETCYDIAKVYNSSADFNNTLPQNRSSLKFEISKSSLNTRGYLDYFEIYYQKELKAFDDFLNFYSQDTTSIIQYRLGNFSKSNIVVFDVSDYSNVKVITDHLMLSMGECIFQSSESQGKVSKYIAIGNDNFKTPVNQILIENSNLRGIAEGAQFIIITHKNFLEAARRLKSFRENEASNKISSIIIDVEKIFNEFSCGIHDISAIRDFLKHAYDSWSIAPEYVLLFGSGNYDYKNLEGYNTNFIPTFQSINSFHEVDSYSTDDFFANIDNKSKIDFVIGRITVKTLDEANNYVNKIIEYEIESSKGLWRNNITFVADDGYTSKTYEGNLHTRQSETLANIYTPRSFNINKIYMAAYPVVLTGQGKRMPAVNQAIIEAINDGTLIINYIGHGASDLWAHEVVFDQNVTIPQLHNDKYFFLVAATCSFGLFDRTDSRAASEDLLFLNKAGSIASLTASRATYPNENENMNNHFFTNLLKNEGEAISIGKALFLTKQTHTGDNAQKYHIFGDPTLRLNIPEYTATIDSINGLSFLTEFQIKALGKVRIDGAIRKPDNALWDNYNGEGILTVFDSERKVFLDQIKYTVSIPGGLIFRGRVSITNGRYNAEFTVPKDISYEDEKGKIVFYFYSNNEDGLGFTDNIIVGGTDSTTANDGTGPEMEIYFDEPSFSSSFLVSPDSRLIVKLNDETGINTTGTGVGHQLEGILNDNETNPIDFTGFFTGDLDAGGKSGEVNYTFEGIETGEYKLDVKAWDVFNNFSKETAYFSVVTGNDLVIRDVYNYPNPFAQNTTFTFQQNLSSNLDVEVKIYTIAGRLIKVLERNNISDRFVTIDWDGRDDDGDQLGNGTYLYKLKIATTDGQFSKSVLGKLAVIR